MWRKQIKRKVSVINTDGICNFTILFKYGSFIVF